MSKFFYVTGKKSMVLINVPRKKENWFKNLLLLFDENSLTEDAGLGSNQIQEIVDAIRELRKELKIKRPEKIGNE